MDLDINSIYVISQNMVAREIEDELIIVPLMSGIGNLEDELYTLNDTAKAIWNKLKNQNKLVDIIQELAIDYNEDLALIQEDVIGLVTELYKRGIVNEQQQKE